METMTEEAQYCGLRGKFRLPIRLGLEDFVSLGRPPVHFFKPLQQFAPTGCASITMLAVRVVDSQASEYVANPASQVHKPPVARVLACGQATLVPSLRTSGRDPCGDTQPPSCSR